MTDRLAPAVVAATDAIYTKAFMLIYEDAGELDDDTARRVKALLSLYSPKLAQEAIEALAYLGFLGCDQRFSGTSITTEPT